MNVSEAATRIGTTPRMLRYREALGLLSPERTAAGYRVYRNDDLLAARMAAELESAYGVPPAAIAFALRALDDPEVNARLRQLRRLAQRAEAPSLAILDFEKAKARRLLGLAS